MSDKDTPGNNVAPIICGISTAQQAVTDAIRADAQVKAAIVRSVAEAAAEEMLEQLRRAHPAVAARVLAKLQELPDAVPFASSSPSALPAAGAPTPAPAPAPAKRRGRPRKSVATADAPSPSVQRSTNR